MPFRTPTQIQNLYSHAKVRNENSQAPMMYGNYSLISSSTLTCIELGPRNSKPRNSKLKNYKITQELET
jgi:hypothetical protein